MLSQMRYFVQINVYYLMCGIVVFCVRLLELVVKDEGWGEGKKCTNYGLTKANAEVDRVENSRFCRSILVRKNFKQNSCDT